jgi:hypothetical protein
MKKWMFVIAILCCILFAALSTHKIFAQSSKKEDITTKENTMNLGFISNIINEALGFADSFVDKNTNHVFEDEKNLAKEKIGSTGIQTIKLDSIPAALYIDLSPDADFHLAYSKQARFEVSHKIDNGMLTIFTDTLFSNGNKDILKVSIPSSTKGLEITGAASYVQFKGQEHFLETVNIEAGAASVLLENIFAETSVKTGAGTIRMKNESVRSNINLQSNTGVIDVTLNDFPEDVSLYTSGMIVNNNLDFARNSISQNERFAVCLENKIGVINIHNAD